MHNCSNCGKEFEGRFCPDCGTEWIDERKRCPKCGKPVADEAKFCTKCGARLDGKVACPNCGREAEEGTAFCEECGTKLTANAGAKAIAVGGKFSLKSILSVTGIACLLMSALFGLIFTFVSGVTMTSGDASETQMLYYYFGDAYIDIDSIIAAIKSNFNFVSIGSTREFAIYFPVVLGTVFAACGILGVVICSALTAWKAYVRLNKKQSVNVAAPAVGAFLCFAVLASILLILNSSKADNVEVSFSAPTLAGLIVGGVFCGSGVLLLAVSDIEKLKPVAARISLCGAAAATVFTVLVISFVSQPSAGYTFKGALSSYGSDGKFGLLPLMQSMLLFVGDDDIINTITAFGTIGGIASVAIAIVAAVILVRKLSGFSHCKNRSTISLSAVMLMISIVYLVFSILTINKVLDAIIDIYAGGSEEALNYIGKTFAMPIVILVMSVLAFASELFAKIAPYKIKPLQTL